MLDLTNLAWPETPFGAHQRPNGRRAHVLTAVDIGWARAPRAAELFPRCVATIYMRVTPARRLTVDPATVPFGFRAAVAGAPDETAALLDLFDGALVRARRHAYLLAGSGLGADLARLDTLARGGHPGIATVFAAWDARATKDRGLARLHDIADLPGSGDPDLDVDPFHRPGPTDMPPAPTATDALTRCLAIGLAAGRQAGLLTWEGTFTARSAVDAAAWDILSAAVSAPDAMRP